MLRSAKNKLNKITEKRISLIRPELKSLKVIFELGRGGFGVVYLTKGPENIFFALKRVRKSFIVRSKAIHQIFSERDILRKIHHPSIIELFKLFV